MGEEAVVGEVVGEETTTQRRGFWAKSRSPKSVVFFLKFFLKSSTFQSGLDRDTRPASKVTPQTDEMH